MAPFNPCKTITGMMCVRKYFPHIHHWKSPFASFYSTKTENEEFSDEEDYHTNLMKTRLELSPSLFQNSGKQSIAKIKEIKEITDTICKIGTTKDKDVATRSTKLYTIK